MTHATKCNEDSDDIPHTPLILFLSFLLVLSVLYILYLNIHIFNTKKKKFSKSSDAITQCNLIKMQQITIHPDKSIHMIEQAL